MVVKRWIVGVVLISGVVLAIAWTIYKAVLYHCFNITFLLLTFVTVLIGFLSIATPFLIPVMKGKTRAYVQVILSPLIAAACMFLLFMYIELCHRISGMEVIIRLLPTILSAIITPVLVLMVTSLCCSMEDKISRFGIPSVILLIQIFFTGAALASINPQNHDLWVLLFQLELLPIIAMALYMTKSIICWLCAPVNHSHQKRENTSPI